MTDVKKFNDQSIGEEIANSISHGIGALLAVAGTVIMIVMACIFSDAMGIVCSALYGFSLIVLYLMSTLYHAITNRKAKRIFQVFDHCSIFILILGSYIPICLSLLGGWIGWTLFGINAGCTVLGIVFNSIDIHKWHKASLVLYVLMGWSVVVAAIPMLHMVPVPGLALLVAGGISYSVGILFYRAKRPRYMHSIWHMFVLGGSVLHYFFILFYIIL